MADAVTDVLLTSLSRFAGNRDGCFEGVKLKADVAVVCHEVRAAALAPDERLVISFRVAGRREATVTLANVGDLCTLKAVSGDAVIRMGVWAVEEPRPQAGRVRDETPVKKRACGEIAIPLKYLITKCDCALYHSWVALDSPGINDSVASVVSDAGQDPSASFAQALAQGPRQLSQLKACLSVLRSEDLGASDQVLWTSETSRKDRVAHWSALLRSQQQHALMCAAQQLQTTQVNNERRVQAAHRADNWEETAAEQEREIARLREQLRQQKERAGAAGSQERAAGRIPDGQAQLEIDKQLVVEEELKRESAALEQELAKITDEANNKIHFANVRIRGLRQERDDIARDVEQQEASLRQVQATVAELKEEKVKLEEQKTALFEIVEDLHQTCDSAGLNMTQTMRHSIQSSSMFKFG